MQITTDERVKFNVGGTIFETNKTTLKALGSKYLDTLLISSTLGFGSNSGFAFGFTQPADRVHFIDRDPDCFRALLNIARYGETYVEGKVSTEMLQKEADFYAVNDWCRDRLKCHAVRGECPTQLPRSHHLNLLIKNTDCSLQINCYIDDTCKEIHSDRDVQCSQCKKQMEFRRADAFNPFPPCQSVPNLKFNWCHLCWKCIDCINKE